MQVASGLTKTSGGRCETGPLDNQGVPRPVWGMSISRDDKQLATGADDEKIRVFDLSTNEELETLSKNFAIRRLAFSHAGYDLQVGGRTGQVEVWVSESGQWKITTLGHSGTVAGAASSVDDPTIASVRTDKTSRLWDAKTGGKQLALEGHSGGIYCVAFSTDGSRIVTGGWGQTVRMWETASGTLHQICDGHNGDVWAVSFCESTRLAPSAKTVWLESEMATRQTSWHRSPDTPARFTRLRSVAMADCSPQQAVTAPLVSGKYRKSHALLPGV